MLDKLKDAMANMVEQDEEQSAKESQSAQNSQDSKQGGQEKGNQKGAQNQKGSQNDSQDAVRRAIKSRSRAIKARRSRARMRSRGTSRRIKIIHRMRRAGIGASDGDKAAKEAEQLAAMGKISEIIGKRSQNVTGEVMVGSRVHQTAAEDALAQKQATHVEAGSEIHRDEVPLIYQQFVEQYFRGGSQGGRGQRSPGAKARRPRDGE